MEARISQSSARRPDGDGPFSLAMKRPATASVAGTIVMRQPSHMCQEILCHESGSSHEVDLSIVGGDGSGVSGTRTSDNKRCLKT